MGRKDLVQVLPDPTFAILKVRSVRQPVLYARVEEDGNLSGNVTLTDKFLIRETQAGTKVYH